MGTNPETEMLKAAISKPSAKRYTISEKEKMIRDVEEYAATNNVSLAAAIHHFGLHKSPWYLFRKQVRRLKEGSEDPMKPSLVYRTEEEKRDLISKVNTLRTDSGYSLDEALKEVGVKQASQYHGWSKQLGIEIPQVRSNLRRRTTKPGPKPGFKKKQSTAVVHQQVVTPHLHQLFNPPGMADTVASGSATVVAEMEEEDISLTISGRPNAVTQFLKGMVA